jgi:hypothetical protein
VESTEFSLEESFSFWKSLILTVVFFTVAPITLGVSLFSLLSLTKSEVPKPQHTLSGVRVYASLPSVFPSVDGSFEASDARGELVRQYLERYNSELAAKAPYIVEVSDKYNLDYRLTTAIAQQESNLCKLIPANTFNCWGWGIHSKGTLGFTSYEEAIEAVSRGLREEYLDKGFLSVEEIMSKYTPLSNGSWAAGVTQFMSEME